MALVFPAARLRSDSCGSLYETSPGLVRCPGSECTGADPSTLEDCLFECWFQHVNKAAVRLRGRRFTKTLVRYRRDDVLYSTIRLYHYFRARFPKHCTPNAPHCSFDFDQEYWYIHNPTIATARGGEQMANKDDFIQMLCGEAPPFIKFPRALELHKQQSQCTVLNMQWQGVRHGAARPLRGN